VRHTCLCLRQPLSSKRAVSLLVALVVAGSLASSASAYNQQAGRIHTSGCIGSTCSIRGVRSQIYHQLTWDLPAGADLEAMWIGAQGSSGPELVQDGIVKADTLVTGCGGMDTNGVAKTFYYWISTTGNVLDCIFGQNDSQFEQHSFKVQRCNNSNSQWCTFIDGTQVGQPRDIGLSTAPWAETIGEYNCFCGTDDIDGTFGGTDKVNKWDVTSSGTGGSSPTWDDVQNSDTHRYDNSCGGGFDSTTSNWGIDAVTPGAQWSIVSYLPLTC
jgi:hypothetical protein